VPKDDPLYQRFTDNLCCGTTDEVVAESK